MGVRKQGDDGVHESKVILAEVSLAEVREMSVFRDGLLESAIRDVAIAEEERFLVTGICFPE